MISDENFAKKKFHNHFNRKKKLNTRFLVKSQSHLLVKDTSESLIIISSLTENYGL
jgi:hypothetical protein